MDTEALLAAAYSAGYFDGEGSVGIRQDKSQVSSWRFYLRIAACDKETIDRIHAYWGGRVSKVKKQKDYWKQAYEWSLHGLDAVAFAKAIIPFCSAKDDQLHLFINAYDDYASTKLPGTGQNKERQNKRNHLMMHSKLALEAMRSASAFNSCGTGKPSSCGGS